MSVNSIVQFLIMAREHRSAQDLLADFEYLLADYKIEAYGILIQPKPHEDPMSLLLAGRWPDGWPQTYIEKKYVLVDPTIRYLGRARGGYSWSDALKAYVEDPHYKRMKKMLSDAAKYGLTDGYVLPVYGRQGLMGNMTIGVKDLLLTPVEVILFEQVAKVMFYGLLAFRGETNAKGEESLPLTKRELEVLSFLADGLTSQEIGKVLSLSSHTVDWYMNTIQEKLGAKNRQHSVSLAFRAGYIS